MPSRMHSLRDGHATTSHRWLAVGVLVGSGIGCGARAVSPTATVDGGSPPMCTGAVPTCVAPADDPCGPPALVPAQCDATSLAWACPTGSRTYARATASSTSCLPLSQSPGVAGVGGSLVRVPTDDGRCLWIAESVTLTNGTTISNVAFAPDLTVPFGTCIASAPFASGSAVSAVRVDGGDDGMHTVQIAQAYQLGGATHVVYRLFHIDPMAVYGVTLIGSGIARFDGATQQIVVPAAGSPAFGTEFDLGDAAHIVGDHAYVWGCPAPAGNFRNHCLLTRLDAHDAYDVFEAGGRWVTDAPAPDAILLFDSGPWISSVAQRNDQWMHIYAPGFGTTLENDRASQPEGPWTHGTTLSACDLPGDDPHAFCAGPVVHEELADPMLPAEFPITYGVGSTNARTDALPTEYASRMLWVRGM